MILFDDDMLIFSIKVLNSKRGISKVELIDGFKSNLDLMDFLISVIFKHEIIAFHYLSNILFNFVIHLIIKAFLHCLT